MANLLTFIDECLAIATDNGLSSSKSIIITVESPIDGIKTQIICSHTEPHDVVLPYNVTWIDSSPISPDYKSAYKRTSKDPANGLVNTWVEVLDYNTIFTPTQYYDGTDLPTVESQQADIQVAIDHVNKNVLSGDPHKARFYTDLKNNATLGAVRAVEFKADNNTYLISLLQNKISNLELEVNALKAGGSVNSQVYYQESSAATWLISHDFDTIDVICQIYDDSNNPILPSSMNAFDENSWIIHFDIPISGKAVLVGV